MSRQWRGSESGESGVGLKFSGRPSESSLSTERHNMKEQLEGVRSTLNQLVDAPVPMGSPIMAGAAMGTPPPGRPTMPSDNSGQHPVVENLLEVISARLANIEGLYSDMSSRLTQVDTKVLENQRTVRELQHISAGAIHETARLVDFVGTRATAGSVARASVSGTMTPPGRYAASISRVPQPRALDHSPGTQVSATIQQHASQIHKLIAGLDFLEQHIIRQDQTVEGLQKQILVSSQHRSRSPNELTLQVHDMSELLNKLRSHLYKVEKKTANSDAALQVLASRLNQMAARMEVLEHGNVQAQVPGTNSSAINPLFFDKEGGSPPEGAPVPRGEAGVSRAEFEELRQQLATVLASINSNHEPAATSRSAPVPLNLSRATSTSVPPGAAEFSTRSTSMSVPPGAVVVDDAMLSQFAHELDNAKASSEALMKQVEELRAALESTSVQAEAERSSVKADVDSVKASIQELVEKSTALEPMAEQLAALQQQVEASVRAEQVEDLVTAAMGSGEDAIKEMLQNQARELNQHLQALAQDVFEAKKQSELVDMLKNEVAELYVQQQSSRQALEAVSDQVVELADKVEANCVKPEDFAQMQAVLQDVKAFAQEGSDNVAKEVNQLREQLEDTAADQEKLKEAYAKLILDLVEARTQASEALARSGDYATVVQLSAVVNTVEEMQQAVKEASEVSSKVQDSVQRDYINREQLASIFSAREDIRHAVEKIERVFTNPGSVDKESMDLVEESLARAGFSTPRMSAAVEEIQTKLAEALQQIQVLQYRSERSVKQEQFASMQQAMVTLELMLKEQQKQVPRRPSVAGTQTTRADLDASRALSGELPVVADGELDHDARGVRGADGVDAADGGPAGSRELPPAAVALAVRVGVSEEEQAALRSRLAALEEQVAVLSTVEREEGGDIDSIKTAVHDLQLMVVELRSEGIARALAAAAPADSRPSQAGNYSFISAACGTDTPTRMEPMEPEGAAGSAGSAATGGGQGGLIATAVAGAATAALSRDVQALQERVDGLEGSLFGKLSSLEAHVYSLRAAPETPGAEQQQLAVVQAGAAVEQLAAQQTMLIELRTSVDELEAAVSVLKGQVSGMRQSSSGGLGDAAAAGAVPAVAEARSMSVGAVDGSPLDELRQEVQQLQAEVGVLSRNFEGLAMPATLLQEKLHELDGIRAQLTALEASQAAAAATAATVAANNKEPPPSAAAVAMQEQVGSLAVAVAEVSKDVKLLEQTVQTHEESLALLTGLKEQLAGLGRADSAASSVEEALGVPPAVPAAAAAAAAAVPGQANFLHRLVDVVRRQSRRMRGQYGEEAQELEDVDRKLSAVEQTLDTPAAQTEAQGQYAEAMVTILEQVAALRTIGSQTHPAIREMLLSHEQQLGELQQQLREVVGAGGADAIAGRLARLEASVAQYSESAVALDKAVHTLVSSSGGADGQVAGSPALAALAAKLSQVEEQVQLSMRQQLLIPSARTSQDGSVDSQSVSAMETKLSDYGKAMHAMRNRIIALQEYIDSTQGMVKELHTVHGNVLIRLGNLESAAVNQPAGGSSDSAAGPQEGLSELTNDVRGLETRVAEAHASTAQALEKLQKLGQRLDDTDAKDTELANKLAAIGQTMPVLAGQLKNLERKLHAKLCTAFDSMESLGRQLVEIPNMQKPNSKNPFAAIAPAGSNPAVMLLEMKFEALRSAMHDSTKSIVEDFKSDRKARVSEP